MAPRNSKSTHKSGSSSSRHQSSKAASTSTTGGTNGARAFLLLTSTSGVECDTMYDLATTMRNHHVSCALATTREHVYSGATDMGSVERYIIRQATPTERRPARPVTVIVCAPGRADEDGDHELYLDVPVTTSDILADVQSALATQAVNVDFVFISDIAASAAGDLADACTDNRYLNVIALERQRPTEDSAGQLLATLRNYVAADRAAEIDANKVNMVAGMLKMSPSYIALNH